MIYARLKQVLVCILLAAAITLTVFACQYIRTLNTVTESLPGVLDHAIAREGDATRVLVGQTANKLDRQITGIRSDVRSLSQDVIRDATAQIAGARKDIDDQLTVLNSTINSQASTVTVPAADLIAKATELQPPLLNTLHQVSETSDLALDCDHNPDCVFNRYVGVARSVEKTAGSIAKMSDVIAKETPETAAAVKNTSKDLSVITARFARPTTWIKGILMNAASVAGKFLGW